MVGGNTFLQHLNTSNNLFIIIGKYKATKEVWFVGDHLLRDAHSYLQAMEYAYKHGDHNYLHATYDTYVFYPDFTETNYISMITNSVTKGFNSRPRFPNAIIIVTGTGIIVEDELFLPSELEKKIRWVFREIASTIATCKSLVKPKCFTFGEPRIFWVKNFQTTSGDPVPSEYLVKFNNLVRRVASGKAIYTPSLDLFVASMSRCYDRKNRVLEKSFKEFWLSVSDMLKTIDERDEHYYINKKVEERLKELKQDGELKFERKASTYLAVTGKKNFSDRHQDEAVYGPRIDRGRDHERHRHDRDHRNDRKRSTSPYYSSRFRRHHGPSRSKHSSY